MPGEPLTHHWSNRRCAVLERGALLTHDWQQVDCEECYLARRLRRAIYVALIVSCGAVLLSVMIVVVKDRQSQPNLMPLPRIAVTLTPYPTVTPTPKALPTQSPIEQAEPFCAAYTGFTEEIRAEAGRTRDTALSLFVWEIQTTYSDSVGEYCTSAEPPPLSEFFIQIRPETQWEIPEDAELGNNAQVCMDFYYDIHGIFIEALSGIIKGEDWFSGFWEAAALVDFGGEMRGGFMTGGMGQVCPCILEQAAESR